ncbi:MAG: DotD/TraH family lipoprotein [Acidithiobacillus ferriphilus]
MKTRIALSLLAAGLSGCAAHPHVEALHTVPLTQASLWLNHSAAVAATSLQHLDQITEVHLTNPAVAVSHVSGVSGMTDRLSLHWSGPVNRLMAQLAQRIGWRYALAIHPTPMPDVAVWNTNAPLPVIVREINTQMVHVATLRILPLGRTLELTRYNPQWIPQHPVLKFCPPLAGHNPVVKPFVQPATVGKGGSIRPFKHILTVGKHGSLYPLPEGPHGPNIPLQTALSHHWKLVMPAYPNLPEKQIARKWMAAGGILYRPQP